MSHTTKANYVTFFHNGDFSGEVQINGATIDGGTVEIDFEDLKILFAEYLRSKLISAVESASCDELLFGALNNHIQLKNDK